MSNLGDMEDRIVAALKALPGLAGADVESGLDLRALSRLSFNRPTVFVVYGGTPGVEDPPAGQRTSQLARLSWLIVTVSSSLRSPTDAAKGAGKAYDLAEKVRAIRAVDIGAANRPVFLSLAGERLETPPDRPDQGGSVAYVCDYRTTPHYI